MRYCTTYVSTDDGNFIARIVCAKIGCNVAWWLMVSLCFGFAFRCLLFTDLNFNFISCPIFIWCCCCCCYCCYCCCFLSLSLFNVTAGYYDEMMTTRCWRWWWRWLCFCYSWLMRLWQMLLVLDHCGNVCVRIYISAYLCAFVLLLLLLLVVLAC